LVPLLFDIEDDVYTKEGINFSALKHLDAIGLISFKPLSGYRKIGFHKNVLFHYFGTPLLVEFNKDKDNELATGKAIMTKAGQELVNICGAQRNDKFYDYVIEKLFAKDLVLSTPLPNQKPHSNA